MVTFFKDRRAEFCTVLDLDTMEATKYMSSIEKKYGKEITTRTWKTIGRVLRKMEIL